MSTANHKVETFPRQCVAVGSRRGGATDRLRDVNMPGTSSDTDMHIEREKGGKEALDHQNQPSHNIVSIISQFGDDNLSLVRVGTFLYDVAPCYRRQCMASATH